MLALLLTFAYAHLSKEFRSANDDPKGNPQTGLWLHLEDFATEALVGKQTTWGKTLFISSVSLCAYLQDAELCDSKIKQRAGVSQALKSGVRKRRRSRTPPEHLNADDEHRFQEDEYRTAKRAERGDLSY